MRIDTRLASARLLLTQRHELLRQWKTEDYCESPPPATAGFLRGRLNLARTTLESFGEENRFFPFFVE